MKNLQPAWVGPDHHEARLQEALAREAGLSVGRARVIGNIGSRRDCWAFRKKLAEVVGISVRTVQRAITQAKALGLIEVHPRQRERNAAGGRWPYLVRLVAPLGYRCVEWEQPLQRPPLQRRGFVLTARAAVQTARAIPPAGASSGR